jgi:hypothetical protein
MHEPTRDAASVSAQGDGRRHRGSVAASGCTVANSRHGGYDPNTLRIVLSQEPPTLEPCESSLTSTGIVVRSNITEPLIEREPNSGDLQPLLATECARSDSAAAYLVREDRADDDQHHREGPRPEGVLINVGRGPLVQQQALYEALAGGVICAAAIDVWYRYPSGGGTVAPSDLPFADLPNILMTPHSSGVTTDTFIGRTDDIAANIGCLQRGDALRNVVSRT